MGRAVCGRWHCGIRLECDPVEADVDAGSECAGVDVRADHAQQGESIWSSAGRHGLDSRR
jgi:hypothetical protein